VVYTVDTSGWYDFDLCTLILISLKFAVRQKHVLAQTTAAASAAVAAAYSRPRSTNHGIFLITLCFADSIEEPYDSPAQYHGNNLLTARSQTHAMHARHHLSDTLMYSTKGMQSCYFTDHISHCSVRMAYQLRAVADIICSLCSLQPSRRRCMHQISKEEHRRCSAPGGSLQQSLLLCIMLRIFSTLWDRLQVLMLAVKCFTSRRCCVCSSFGLHSFHAVLHRVPVLPLLDVCTRELRWHQSRQLDVCSCM